METQLSAKNQKKILNGQGCRTGTDGRTYGRTYVRTYESEFIGSFRSLKTSEEPINYKKQRSPVSDQVLDNSDARFRKKCKKPHFWAKIAKFWTKKGCKNGQFFFVRA